MKKDDGKSGRDGGRLERTGKSRPYVMRDPIRMTISENTLAADIDGRRSLTAGFASGVVGHSTICTINVHLFSVFLCEVALPWIWNCG